MALVPYGYGYPNEDAPKVEQYVDTSTGQIFYNTLKGDSENGFYREMVPTGRNWEYMNVADASGKQIYGTQGYHPQGWAFDESGMAPSNDYAGYTEAGYQLGDLSDPNNPETRLANYAAARGYAPKYDPDYGWVLPSSAPINAIRSSYASQFRGGGDFITNLIDQYAVPLAMAATGAGMAGLGGLAAEGAESTNVLSAAAPVSEGVIAAAPAEAAPLSSVAEAAPLSSVAEAAPLSSVAEAAPLASVSEAALPESYWSMTAEAANAGLPSAATGTVSAPTAAISEAAAPALADANLADSAAAAEFGGGQAIADLGINPSLAQSLVDSGVPAQLIQNLPSVSTMAQNAAINAATQLVTTGDIDPSKILTSIVTGAAGTAVGSTVAQDVLSDTDSALAASIVSGATKGALQAAITGADPLQTALASGAASGLGFIAQDAGVPIPQKVINSVVSSVASGQPLDQVLTGAVIAAGSGVARDAISSAYNAYNADQQVSGLQAASDLGNAPVQGFDNNGNPIYRDSSGVWTNERDVQVNPATGEVLDTSSVEVTPYKSTDAVAGTEIQGDQATTQQTTSSDQTTGGLPAAVQLAETDTGTITDVQNTDALQLATDYYNKILDNVEANFGLITKQDADAALQQAATQYGIDPSQLDNWMQQTGSVGTYGMISQEPVNITPSIVTDAVNIDNSQSSAGDLTNFDQSAAALSDQTNVFSDTGALPTSNQILAQDQQTTSSDQSTGALPAAQQVMPEILVEDQQPATTQLPPILAGELVGRYIDPAYTVELPTNPAPLPATTPVESAPSSPLNAIATDNTAPSSPLPAETTIESALSQLPATTPVESSILMPYEAQISVNQPTDNTGAITEDQGRTGSDALFYDEEGNALNASGEPVYGSHYDVLTDSVTPSVTTSVTPAVTTTVTPSSTSGGLPTSSTYGVSGTLPDVNRLLSEDSTKYPSPLKPYLQPNWITTGTPTQTSLWSGLDPKLVNILSRGMAHGGEVHPQLQRILADRGYDINPVEMVFGPEDRYYARHAKRGFAVQGPGTGQSDDIPTMLADGEYVFDADTVAALGDGSSKAGAEALDKMREAIRAHKRSAPVDKIPPKAKSPLDYLKMANKGKKNG